MPIQIVSVHWIGLIYQVRTQPSIRGPWKGVQSGINDVIYQLLCRIAGANDTYVCVIRTLEHMLFEKKKKKKLEVFVTGVGSSDISCVTMNECAVTTHGW